SDNLLNLETDPEPGCDGTDANPVQDIIKDIDSIEPAYWYYRKYINLSEDYADRLRKALGAHMQSLFAGGRLAEANEVLAHVYAMTEQMSRYDYCQVLPDVVEDCIGYWHKIIRNCSGRLRAQLYEQFIGMAGTVRMYDSFNEKIGELLCEEFTDSRAAMRRRLKQVNETLEWWDRAQSPQVFRRYGALGQNVLKKLELMACLGYSPEETDAVIRKYWQVPEVRDRKVELLLVQGDLESAIQVLQESKALDKGDDFTQTQNSATLIDLYSRLGRTEEYKQELAYYLFDAAVNTNFYRYQAHDSLSGYISRLEDACTPEEWAAYRERILQDEKFIQEWCPLMAKDGLYERLLDQILEWQSVEDMDRYEDLLKPLFPEQLKKFYADYIIRESEPATSREYYARLAAYLAKLCSYPGGDVLAADIAGQWKARFPRRIAMMDELARAGF
ncbi:MAG: hypothetical protein LUD51_00105, partial [Clostridia bacterium]|nr:hypothetical protein [Clostridia bacterium]